jgi:uncharacterized coiled-coil protein SlyX
MTDGPTDTHAKLLADAREIADDATNLCEADEIDEADASELLSACSSVIAQLADALAEESKECERLRARLHGMLTEDLSLVLGDFDEATSEHNAKVRGLWAPKLFAAAFQQNIDDVGAENYLEIGFTGTTKDGSPAPFTVRIQRHEGKTPDTMRQEAVARAEKAEAEVKRLRERLCAPVDGEAIDHG